jgi:adenylate kinase family enzyme
MVHVSTSNLLELEREKKSQIGQHSLSILQQKLQTPDDIICSLVQHRINQTDCMMHGYFLDGFPITNKQWERFQQWHVQPSIVICYRVDSSEIQDNIDKSHIDLTNGEIYDAAELADMPDEAKEGLVPTSDEIKDRLRLRNYFIPWLKKIRGEEYRPSVF